MAKVAGMAGRLVRGTAIAGGVAAIAGLVLGVAAGEPVEPEDVKQARKLPADLCGRLGDLTPLLPKATNGAPKPVAFAQTGTTVVRCTVQIDEQSQPTYTGANLTVTITPHGGKLGGAGQPPITPEAIAKVAFDRKPMKAVEDRPYPTKLSAVGRTGEEDWRVSALVLRGDLIVQVDYSAHPIQRKAAEQAALVLADRALWEAK